METQSMSHAEDPPDVPASARMLLARSEAVQVAKLTHGLGKRFLPGQPDPEADVPPTDDKFFFCHSEVLLFEMMTGRFVRVDLYSVAGRVHFGELTFVPHAATGALVSDSFGRWVMSRIRMPGWRMVEPGGIEPPTS